MNDESADRAAQIETFSSLLSAPAAPARVRLWPAAVILALEGSAIFLPQILAPNSRAQYLGMSVGPIAGTLAFLLWWLLASRAPWRYRGGILAAFVVLVLIAGWAMERSLGMAMVLGVYAVPLATAVWVVSLALTGGLAWPLRSIIVLAGLVAVVGPVPLLRLEGTDGSLRVRLAWRWQPRPEDRALEALARYEQAARLPPPKEADELRFAGNPWPEFRGPRRDGKVPGVRIATDWAASAPAEIWRRPVGPGWSSFAIAGDLAFTQEQRGGDEAVVCYEASTGRQLWAHADGTKFDEAMGGVGPRATPTFHQDRLFTLGANGILNCLEARTGESVWSRNIAEDTDASVPTWGFSSSPLILGGLVIVYAGQPRAGMVAYAAQTGQMRWTCKAGTHGYSSPHLATIGGAESVLMMSNAGLTAAEPDTGSLLWHYDWAIDDGSRIIQPAVLENGEILIGTGYGHGTHRIRAMQSDEGWRVETIWESRHLKPYFNDLVCHKGYVYGFDGRILTCLDLVSGERVWKGGRYGHGQLLLLEDQDVLLVLSETGGVALVEAQPRGFQELATFQALNGKTWNHPVVAHGKLFVRNANEAACYDLPLQESGR